jgi:hypothetical protein
MGLDDATAGLDDISVFFQAADGGAGMLHGTYTIMPLLGYHRLTMLESTGSTGSTSYNSIRLSAQMSN